MEDLSEVEQKIVAMSGLIQADQTNPESFAERSCLFYERELYNQALEDAKTALMYDPQCMNALIAAGRAALKMGKFDQSYAFYKDGLEIDPKNNIIIEDLKLLQKNIVSEYERKAESIKEDSYNAVQLCSQDVYPGDNELYKLEIEILQRKYKIDPTKAIAPTQVDLKVRKDAASFAVMAFNFRKDGMTQEALQSIQVAVGKDGGNYRLIQMRAEIWHDLGEDINALRDVVGIPKPCREMNTWKLGGKLLKKFELPVMAEFWYRKATQMIPESEKNTDLESAIEFQKIRVKRIYGPLTMDFPVTVNFTDYGRAVFATDNLESGEDAFEDTPVVVGQVLSTSHLPGCDHCGMSMISPLDYFGTTWEQLSAGLRSFVNDLWPEVEPYYCSCKREKYCSVTCRGEAWDSYHQIICPNKNAASSEMYDIIDNKGYIKKEKGLPIDAWTGQYSPMLLAKIWGIIIAEAKRQMKAANLEEPTTEIWASAKMPFRKFISYGVTSAVKRMPEMYDIMKRMFADCGDGLKYDITEQEFEARYYQATCNLQSFGSSYTPKHRFMEKLAKTEDIRSLQLLKHLDKKVPSVLFAGMFPLHACLNHACDNNVEVMEGYVNGRPGVHVRVKKDIKPGDELFTTYIDTTMPRKLRRAWLYKSFNFWCNCKLCQFEGDDNSTCTNCKKAAGEGKKFLGCSKCKRAWYCSTKCQKQSWVKGHRSICSMMHSQVHMQVSEK
ncbi:hypothetical protein ACF0H5_006296 [Mactra antiquata]